MSPLLKLARAHAALGRLLDHFQSLVLLTTRLYVGWQFWKSGWLKVTSWSTTLGLFRTEYHVPLLPPPVAAITGAGGELFFPTLLFLGLVALIPAASSMLYAIPGRGPPTIYIGLIMLLSTVQALSWGYAAFIGKLAAADVTQAQRVYVFLIALLTPSIFAGLSLLGLYQGGRLGAGVWLILIGVVVAVRIASRRILKDLRY